MAEQATAAREEVDKLREAFEKYDTAVEKLKQCKKGTQEWRDALKEVNTVVANLIREFPNLAGSLEILRDQSGQIVIENAEEVMQEAE
jgi:archaellum component FlaC